MSAYMVTDTLTRQQFPGDSVHDVQEAVWFILSGSDLSDSDYEAYDGLLVEVEDEDFYTTHSSDLGIRVEKMVY